MPVVIQTNSSEREKLDKTLTTVATLTGTLRAETSILDPVILVSGSTLAALSAANYMTIADFGRSYFITGIRSIRQGLVELSGHVDVLSTYKTQIRQNSAILRRSERNWNLYLNDGSLMVEQRPHVITQEFSSGGAMASGSSFILALAG